MDNEYRLDLSGTIMATTYETVLPRSMHSHIGSSSKTLLAALSKDGPQGNIGLQCGLSLLLYEVLSNGKQQGRNDHGACIVYNDVLPFYFPYPDQEYSSTGLRRLSLHHIHSYSPTSHTSASTLLLPLPFLFFVERSQNALLLCLYLSFHDDSAGRKSTINL